MAKPWKYKIQANTKQNHCNRCNNVFCGNYDNLSEHGCFLGKNYRVCGEYKGFAKMDKQRSNK